MKPFALVSVFVGIVAIGAATVWVAVCQDRWLLPPADAVRRKTFSRTIAEGVRYRDVQQKGVDRLSFKTCRIEKRRSGAISFGAFNVLVVEDLVLNLADVRSQTEKKEDGDVQDQIKKTTTADFAGLFAHIQGLTDARFSGVRIERLQVNRCSSNAVSRVLSAESAESRIGQNGLTLRRCCVFDSCETGEAVEQAHLVFNPAPALVYNQGGKTRCIPLAGETSALF